MLKSIFLIAILALLFIVAGGTAYLVYCANGGENDAKNTNVEEDRTGQDVPPSERYATEYIVQNLWKSMI
ncbi:hypothetical protein B1B04_12440 [Lysinibacillus sp. KCTC 33748]|uniref:hypothetical protein n=1 Tax=unclassified Lysinibacillus TaxID=2636778 RepID=UPI0009A87ECA|nr:MULTISPECIES: hypothetical protein [unclassified Lysinibacillus]OXS73526.1 hypothetical protein B1B04_12440 [Lysinibacillus sp. KCTC 33748]SKB79481.1 hypothetical protein SAMN06295926_10890 [Lysinibacillus sp. AC-3]